MELIEARKYEAITEVMGPMMIDLLNDDSVIEILRNPNGSLCIERLDTGIQEITCSLLDNDVKNLIRLLADHANEICNDKKPSLSLKLPYWNGRFQGLLPPVVEAPTFSIRKHIRKTLTLENYLELKAITHEQYHVIQEAVLERHNIVISGGTGSGKTTLANAILAKMVSTNDRIITLEDTAELSIDSPKAVRIFTRTDIQYDAQTALKDILRLRPDRIVVGEVRDKACLDLIKAWNTGHAGGLTTLHANSAKLALKRIESLILEASLNVPKDLISQTVNIIIQIERQGTKRMVTGVSKIIGLDDKDYILRQF